VKTTEIQQKISVSDTVFESLKHEMATGKWSPGEKLPSESKLCALYGVSRVSLRTALNRLSVLGLVESRQGGGTYVRELSGAEHLQSIIPLIVLEKPDRINMFEFRKIIETESAALAAVRADFDCVTKLQHANRRMKTASSVADISEADLDFHYLIARATANPLIIKVFEILHDNYLALFTDNVTLIGSRGAADHDGIIASIETRDAQGAKDLMKKHLDETAKRLTMQKATS